MDQVLEILQTKSKNTKNWLRDLYLHGTVPACKNILESLISQDILIKEEGKFLLVFPYTKFLPKNLQIKDEIVQRIQQAALEHKVPSLQNISLMLLLQKSDLLKDFFSRNIKSVEEGLQGLIYHQNSLGLDYICKVLFKIIKDVDSAADSVILTVS